MIFLFYSFNKTSDLFVLRSLAFFFSEGYSKNFSIIRYLRETIKDSFQFFYKMERIIKSLLKFNQIHLIFLSENLQRTRRMQLYFILAYTLCNNHFIVKKQVSFGTIPLESE